MLIKMRQEIFDVIVIGGGASGMMAAGRAAERGKRVLLLEKNKRLGEKLKITGGGRCNVTNAEFDTHKLLAHYGNGGRFLPSPFSQFGVESTFKFFESRGLPLVVEDRKRAFPKTQKALDIFRVLETYLRDGKVTVCTEAKTTRINTDGRKVLGVQCGSVSYTAGAIILATGGMSHAETGSTGDGFAWLRDLGHKVKAPTPTIVPLAVREAWVKALAGVTLKSMKITFSVEGKKQFSRTGSLLFTHFGISGPIILNSADKVGDMLQAGTATAIIDAFPELDLGALDERIRKAFDANKNRDLKNVFKEIAPPGTSTHLLKLLSKIDEKKKVHSVTKEERKLIARTLKALPLTITHLMGFDRAVVADGGVVLEEMDMKTMRSLLFDNLYITGDLLHVRRPSGGYSLQLCWTTGYVAGSHA
ncbi:MAG: NAD(P)/FAD-dependent oxidoreductase [bacterium]|nr:NAD(P)/FAD-dependent oxidoreductase [bacterium]